MHIHPPKPLHGWKAFFNEIFVIVVGVLIALGLEQVVETLHWQHKVHEGEERLKGEIRWNYRSSVERIAFTPCFDAQIDRLANRIRNSGDRFEAAPLFESPSRPGVAYVLFQPLRTINAQIWAALQLDGTATHLGGIGRPRWESFIRALPCCRPISTSLVNFAASSMCWGAI